MNGGAAADGGAAVDRLAEFVAGLSWGSVPADVRERTLLSLADTWGVMHGGRDLAAPTIARGLLADDVAGRSNQGPSAPDTAWLAGICGHVLDFDDTHWPTILHASTPIVAALAAAVSRFEGVIDGERFAEAYLAGFECAARVALSIPRGHYDRGWHITGTVGGIGAAAAVTRIFGGDATRLRSAMSLAADQAAGHRQHFGSMAKSLHAGNAARCGLTSALLVERGFAPAPDGIEGARGMWHVMSDAPVPSALYEGLGETWEMLSNGLKPYPCGVVSHPAIEAAERARDACRRKGTPPTSIELIVHPLVAELTNKQIKEDLDVKFSVPTLVAMGLLDAARDVRMYSAAAVAARQDIRRMSELVVVRSDAGVPQDQATLRLSFEDAEVVVEQVAHALGSPGRPMGESQAREKFVALTSARPADRREPAFDQLVDLAASPDVGGLVSELIAVVLDVDDPRADG